MNKYTYYKVIQENWNGTWDDVDFHETNSQYFSKNRKLFIENLKAYKQNSPVPVRVIKRRELTTA